MNGGVDAWAAGSQAHTRQDKRRAKRKEKKPPPPLERGGWGEGAVPHEPLPPTPSLKGRGSLLLNQAGHPPGLFGQDFWTLLQTGSRPLAMVMGCCVYHIAHQSAVQVLRNLGRNAEVPEYTQAYYNARELAMECMQQEADEAGASGIVGVHLSESSHVRESHVVEYFAIGTAITAVDPAAMRPDAVRPLPVLPLSG